MSNNVIKFKPKLVQVKIEELNNISNSIYFSLEDDSFTYMRFGKVSVIQGKDSFAKCLMLIKS